MAGKSSGPLSGTGLAAELDFYRNNQERLYGLFPTGTADLRRHW